MREGIPGAEMAGVKRKGNFGKLLVNTAICHQFIKYFLKECVLVSKRRMVTLVAPFCKTINYMYTACFGSRS